MRIFKISFLLPLFLIAFTSAILAQNVKLKNEYYKKAMQSQQAAIQKSFYDKASGYYLIELDPSKREKKGDYLREYTYLWSLCAMYQASNEIEKIEIGSKLMEPLLANMNNYYNPAPPKPG